MGHRAWFAIERSYVLNYEGEADYDDDDVPWGVVEEARRRGWDQIWQLAYCQWCALNAHEATEDEDFPWDMTESADDLRQVYGPTARSIFAVVESDEAAWVIPEWPNPELCLWEMKLKGYWQYDLDNTPQESEIWKRMPYWVSPDRPDLLGNYADFWLGNQELHTMMLRMSNAVIQWGFDTPASFARWREVSRNSRYREDDDPLKDTPAWWEPVRDSSPLKAWWFDFLSRMESRPDDRATFLAAWTDTVVAYQRAAAEAGAPDVAFSSPIPDLLDLDDTQVTGNTTINRYRLHHASELSEAVGQTIDLIMRGDIIEPED